MIKAVCDNCGKEEATRGWGSEPQEWYCLSRGTDEAILCGHECVQQFVLEEKAIPSYRPENNNSGAEG